MQIPPQIHLQLLPYVSKTPRVPWTYFWYSKFKYGTNVYTCNFLCACIYYSLHLLVSIGTYINFSTFMITTFCLYQRLNVWVMYAIIWVLYAHHSSGALEHMCNVAAILAQLYMSNMCTVLIVTWLISVISYVASIFVYIFHMNPSYVWYASLTQFDGHICS